MAVGAVVKKVAVEEVVEEKVVVEGGARAGGVRNTKSSSQMGGGVNRKRKAWPREPNTSAQKAPKRCGLRLDSPRRTAAESPQRECPPSGIAREAEQGTVP